VLVELGGVRLLTDPVLRSHLAHLRRHGPPPTPPADVDAVLVSHVHYDHLDLPSLRRLGTHVHLVVPDGAGDFLRGAGFTAVEELAVGDAVSVGEVSVTAVRAVHDDRRRPLGLRAQPLGFLLGRRPHVYFAGDTDLFPELAELPPVDVALLPVAGWGPSLGHGHLDPARAARAAALVRPRVAVPIHWGTLHPRLTRRGSWFTDPPREFEAGVAEVAPGVEVRVLAPGESLAL